MTIALDRAVRDMPFGNPVSSGSSSDLDRPAPCAPACEGVTIGQPGGCRSRGREDRTGLAKPTCGHQLVQLAEHQSVDLANLRTHRCLAPSHSVDASVALHSHRDVGSRAIGCLLYTSDAADDLL